VPLPPLIVFKLFDPYLQRLTSRQQTPAATAGQNRMDPASRAASVPRLARSAAFVSPPLPLTFPLTLSSPLTASPTPLKPRSLAGDQLQHT
jgi:hypothetical protein